MTEQELANVIWDIKEIIRNLYDDAEVENVILPFTLLRRLDCVLDTCRDEIAEAIKDLPEGPRRYKLKSLMRSHGITFYNSSGLSLEKLLGAPGQIGDTFKTYLDGFTDNVKDILANFVHSDATGDEIDLTPIYSRLDRSDKLFAVVQQFVQHADLHPSKVSNAMMGTVFEIVIRRSKESSNTKAGQFYTPREIECTNRQLKTDLNLRPIYHQKDSRSDAHLFFGLLTYWVVNTIRLQLKQTGENCYWTEIVRRMSTQKLVTTEAVNAMGEKIEFR